MFPLLEQWGLAFKDGFLLCGRGVRDFFRRLRNRVSSASMCGFLRLPEHFLDGLFGIDSETCEN